MIKDDKTYIKKYLEPQIVVEPHESSFFIYNFEQAHTALFVLKIRVPNLLCDDNTCLVERVVDFVINITSYN